jgi:hypothetical protein
VILAEFTLPKTVEEGSLSRTVNSTTGLASLKGGPKRALLYLLL